ncbi:MAG: hypothetical protein ONB31_01670 [candidate division KSB1 bacterium]|nr:hypothetical protein [candidate division KSB1 bacterium]MDZ7334389.1 hypothetical protein [candidate division KSB1 bacterium]MDZ7358261.1 hypothetical protein [candidate division KSB1 bacterium]
MYNKIIKFSITFLFLAVTLVSLNAQVQPSLVQQMILAFQQLDYGTAQKIGTQIISDFRKYSPMDLLEAHKILGVIAYHDGRINDANAQFEQALSIDRTANLDSVYVSPKIIQFFEELKAKYNSKQITAETERPAYYRYLIQPDPRPLATLRSMALPGWGQLYKNDRTKGYILITASAILILSTATFHVLEQDAHDQYLSAIDEPKIQEKYDRYNLFFKLRNNTALVYAGVWFYSFFDALLNKPKQQPIRVSFIMQEYPAIWIRVRY